MAVSTNRDVLVETDWVAANLGKAGKRLLDVDEDTEAYGRGHIPGALGIHWKNDLQDPLRRDFIGAEAFAALMDKLGIANDTLVVLYGGNNNWFAAYAYWYFRYYGHQSVRLMDGGRKKWQAEQREMTADTGHVAPASGYRVGTPALDIRALRRFVESDVVGHPAFGLVDVRSPEEYRGELLAPPHLPQEQAQRPGHIPGAINIPWAKAVNPETGAFLPVDELRALYAGKDITADREIVAYCRIGERSAHTWFVLHELLGYPRVRNYDGSWTEWGSLVGPSSAEEETMIDQYSSGTWQVLAGREQEFIARWTEFLEWTRSSSKELHAAQLIQDSDNPRHFVSFASWASAEAMQRWRSSPEFATKLAACRVLCDDFRGSSYTLAATV